MKEKAIEILNDYLEQCKYMYRQKVMSYDQAISRGYGAIEICIRLEILERKEARDLQNRYCGYLYQLNKQDRRQDNENKKDFMIKQLKNKIEAYEEAYCLNKITHQTIVDKVTAIITIAGELIPLSKTETFEMISEFYDRINERKTK